MNKVIGVALAVAGVVLLVLPAFSWHGDHFGTTIWFGPGCEGVLSVREGMPERLDAGGHFAGQPRGGGLTCTTA